jgi:ABC-type uncharacterized transport system involved in gliding motility auxiliary subunit
MRIDARIRFQLLLHNAVFVVLLVALVALLAFVAREYRYERDLTQNARNTVSQQTRTLLRKISGPITVTTYAPRQDVRGDARKQIRDFLAPYQRVKPDLKIEFIDPSEEPKLAQAAGIRFNGESVIEYNHRTEHLTDYNEQTFVNTLTRLMRATERLILSVDGHGERKLDGVANFDLGEFGKRLGAKGFRLSTVNLSLAQEVPVNASALVIANPRVDLQPAEVQKIKLYLEQGGNLLWLIDPEPLHGLQPIAEELGLVLGPGVVWDPTSRRFNAEPTIAIGSSSNYGRHAVTDNFSLNTVFPYARQIGYNDASDSGWRATRLIDVAPSGWVETGKPDGNFDPLHDVKGPVNIALALERTVNDRNQRVIVIGNGSFLSNTYVGNGGNLDLGINVFNWLAGDESLISIEPRPAVDSGLELTRTAQYAVLFGFLILLPLAFIAAGGVTWWRRRRH